MGNASGSKPCHSLPLSWLVVWNADWLKGFPLLIRSCGFANVVLFLQLIRSFYSSRFYKVMFNALPLSSLLKPVLQRSNRRSDRPHRVYCLQWTQTLRFIYNLSYRVKSFCEDPTLNLQESSGHSCGQWSWYQHAFLFSCKVRCLGKLQPTCQSHILYRLLMTSDDRTCIPFIPSRLFQTSVFIQKRYLSLSLRKMKWHSDSGAQAGRNIICRHTFLHLRPLVLAASLCD